MTQSKPEVLASAKFTRDMVETLSLYFEHYAIDDVVSVEVTTHGLWLKHVPTNSRQFLGRADMPERPVAYHPQKKGFV